MPTRRLDTWTGFGMNPPSVAITHSFARASLRERLNEREIDALRMRKR